MRERPMNGKRGAQLQGGPGGLTTFADLVIEMRGGGANRASYYEAAVCLDWQDEAGSDEGAD